MYVFLTLFYADGTYIFPKRIDFQKINNSNYEYLYLLHEM